MTRRSVLDPLLLLTAILAIAVVLLLVYGVWGWGVSLLLASALVLVARAEIGRGGGKLTLAGVRSRAALLGRVMAVRSRGELEVFRARREFAELEAERGRLFRDLGQATYEEDAQGAEAARQALEAVILQLAEKDAAIAELVRATKDRVRRVQAEAETEAAREPGDDSDPG